MKKLLIFPILALLFCCTVNDNTSLWTFTNKSDIAITNIKLGNTIILASLSPGFTYNYYFSWDLNGPLTSNEALSAGYASDFEVNEYTIVRRRGTYNLIAGNYYFYSDIFKKDGEYFITLRCKPNNFEYGSSDSDDYAEGGYYDD
ncbi:MAG: hypothetical protein JXB50_05240 [Spirochaetes bacterium]|nr:hypothetical protein [Spirochaetota bacterium]